MPARAFVWSVVLLLVAATGAPRAGRADAVATGHAKTPIHRANVDAPATGHAQPAGSAGTTLVLLGLLLAGAIIARRLVQQRLANRSGRISHNPVRLVSRQQIDPELSIRLLQVGPRLLVVAATPQGVTTLTEFTDPEEIALLSGEVQTAADGDSLFGGGTMSSGAQPAVPRMRETMPTDAEARTASHISRAIQTGG